MEFKLKLEMLFSGESKTLVLSGFIVLRFSWMFNSISVFVYSSFLSALFDSFILFVSLLKYSFTDFLIVLCWFHFFWPCFIQLVCINIVYISYLFCCPETYSDCLHLMFLIVQLFGECIEFCLLFFSTHSSLFSWFSVPLLCN